MLAGLSLTETKENVQLFLKNSVEARTSQSVVPPAVTVPRATVSSKSHAFGRCNQRRFQQHRRSIVAAIKPWRFKICLEILISERSFILCLPILALASMEFAEIKRSNPKLMTTGR